MCRVLLQPSAHNTFHVGIAKLHCCVFPKRCTLIAGWLVVALQGFSVPGDACSALPSTSDSKGSLLFVNNAAHSNLAGLVLRAVADGGPCTALSNFTTYLSWDFGIITLKGITTDVTLRHVVVAGALACFTAQHPQVQSVFEKTLKRHAAVQAVEPRSAQSFQDRWTITLASRVFPLISAAPWGYVHSSHTMCCLTCHPQTHAMLASWS
jgi:hypothetical protein